ncbi:MAG: M23 family metallopeptidase [Rhizobiales bacterium]|nr:M23 family metallopeptidase [Hyphomicrobiales bacterium]NRB12832.1 M23 family metallopeptidase [Hyphomicrobiales bacterium]
MLNVSQSITKSNFHKSAKILFPALLALGLSACSSDVARFALQDAQYAQQEAQYAQQDGSQIQQSNIGDLPAQVATNSADNEFTASIGTSALAQKSNTNWMYNTNPDSYRVSTGDTLYSISRRFGLTIEELRAANNLDAFASLRIGQNILLPRKGATSVGFATPKTTLANSPAEINSMPQAASLQQTAAAPVQAAFNGQGIYTVRAKDTLYSIARSHNLAFDKLLNLNGLNGTEGLKIGQKIRVDGFVVAPKTAELSLAAVVAPVIAPIVVPQKPVVVAKTAPTSSSNRFRWPVSGRVIAEYGTGKKGALNEGMNVAIPPGTVVKAAEGGTVAYAGNGLKNYGNLILIKHNGGWVTAYAHNGAILVKKGDKVRRGQAIARSGQSGDVDIPQLYFEIRRGALTYNPRKYLAAK